MLQRAGGAANHLKPRTVKTPEQCAQGSSVNQHSNGFRWSKLLALAPGAERSRCGLSGLLGHLWRCKQSVDGSDVPHPVSELTTCPRLGEDCWSRGLQSACFWQVAGWRVVHSGASWVDAFRIAPSLAPGNRRLHALLWRRSGSSVGCLSAFSDAVSAPVAVWVAIGVCRASMPRSGVGVRTQPHARLSRPHAYERNSQPQTCLPGRTLTGHLGSPRFSSDAISSCVTRLLEVMQ